MIELIYSLSLLQTFILHFLFEIIELLFFIMIIYEKSSCVSYIHIFDNDLGNNKQ